MTIKYLCSKIALVACITLSFVSGSAYAAPKVAVSIAPLHSIVSAVLQGVGDAELLISPGQSPHIQGLSPSSIRALNQAELVLWVGDGYEISMAKTMRQLPKHVATIEFLNLQDIDTHKLDDQDEDGHTQSDNLRLNESHQHDVNLPDPHLWLSIGNVRKLVIRLRDQLVIMDSLNATQYHQNTNQFLLQLNQLSSAIALQLRHVEKVPYMVFHDAYTYFELEHDLLPSIAVTLNPQQMPGAKRLSELRAQIQTQGIKCLFSEPQFQSKLVTTLTENTDIKTAQLDPLGFSIQPGPNLWFELMRNLATSFRSCLGDQALG